MKTKQYQVDFEALVFLLRPEHVWACLRNEKKHRKNHNHHAWVLIRVTLIVPACQPGWEEMENLRGNLRTFEGVWGGLRGNNSEWSQPGMKPYDWCHPGSNHDKPKSFSVEENPRCRSCVPERVNDQTTHRHLEDWTTAVGLRIWSLWSAG